MTELDSNKKAISFANREMFRFDYGESAKMKGTDFIIRNMGVRKTIYGDPFDEFYDVYLRLTLGNEEKAIEMGLSSTGAWEEKRTYEWKGFRIELFNADSYHDCPVSIKVTAEAHGIIECE